jgi:hypothetical protein
LLPPSRLTNTVISAHWTLPLRRQIMPSSGVQVRIPFNPKEK